MAVSDPLVAQCDPQVLRLWNEVAENAADRESFTALVEGLREDFPSFCALVLRVRPKGGGGTVPFMFNQVQRRMWREICRRVAERAEPWFVVLKFRQAGMSTFWCAWLFWQMWRQRDIQCMVVAHQLQTAETMIETQKVFYDEMPEAFRPTLREGNHGATIPRGEIYFADRRSWEMIHLAKNVDPRGQQVTHVLETEMAMYPNPEEMNGALLPQLPPFGSEARLRSSFVIESTPKGRNEFCDMYEDARDGHLRSFKAVFFPWFLFEEQYAARLPEHFRLTAAEKEERKRLSTLRKNYPAEDGGEKEVSLEQMYWRRETIASEYRGNVDRFDQEYPSDDRTCFMLASRSIFREHARILEAMVSNATELATEAWNKVTYVGQKNQRGGPLRVRLKPTVQERGHWTPITKVEFEVHPQGQWLVWEPPIDGHKYVLGADPAMGLEDGDNSAICVIDVTSGRQVAEYAGTMGPERFALEIASAGYWYNFALVNPEINNVGYVVLKRLIANITYGNLYKWPKFDEVNRFSHKRGFETNHRTKQLIVSAMINYIEEELVHIASDDLLGEMTTYEQRSMGDYFEFGAQKGRHDDRVMAFGLALMAIDQSPVLQHELLRAQSRLPSARDLHLATTVELPDTPMPKQLKEFMSIKHTIPWNPFGEIL